MAFVTNEFDCYSFFDLDLSDWKFIDDEQQLISYCQPTNTKTETRTRENNNGLMEDEELKDESLSPNKRRLVLKKMASSPSRNSLMLTSNNKNASVVNNTNCRSLPRRISKEPYTIDGHPNGLALYCNLRNKRSVCHEDVPVTGSNAAQTGIVGDERSSYELSVDFQQKQIEILARKYGGHLRARRAAIVIQRAYRKHSMKKKFERLRKRSSLAVVPSKLFVSNIEIDTTNDSVINHYNHNKSKQSSNDERIAPSDYSTTPIVRNLNDSACRNVDNERFTEAVEDELDYKSVTNQIDVSSNSTPIIAVESKEPDCSTSSSVGRKNRNDQQQRQHISSSSSSSTSRGSRHKRGVESVERNLYTATTNVNVTPVEIDTFKLATTTSSNVVGERKIFNSNTNNNSTVLSPIFATSDAQYVSYVRVEGVCKKEDDDENDELKNVFGNTVVDPAPCSSSSSSVDSKRCKTAVSESSTKGDTGAANNRNVVVADQFYAPIKLHEKSKARVHQTKSIDSVKDLCATAASSSSSDNVGVSHSTFEHGKQTGAERCLLRTVSPMSPIWVPRSHSPVKIAVDKAEINSNNRYQDGVAKTYCNNHNNANFAAGALRNNIPAGESRLLQHWVWGRPTLYRASMRRNDVERRRQYRIALNFFNKKPERGVEFLICWGFVDGSPDSVAKFLISRKGLSKQMIGEYLGNLQNPFNMAVLDCFANEVDMVDMEIDVALRKFQSLFRLPGEAQKIERIVEIFARRYCQCNPQAVKLFKQPDTIFVLAFAIIMLNTDLHSPSIKSDRRMKVEDFTKNLRGIDGGCDINCKFLTEIYRRVKEEQFKPGTDHVAQVIKVDRNVVGKKPTLALPHRRLVCYCRLYEIVDPSKKQSFTAHQREVFLFNDMMMVTKVQSRKKNVITYNFRENHCLVGMRIQPFKNQHYANGLQITHTLENKTLYFNARNEDDRMKFIDDLREAICESDEMEALRIELELEKQNGVCRAFNFDRIEQQRDSGLADIENNEQCRAALGINNLSNSLLDLTDPQTLDAVGNEAIQRHPSGTSIDSGMSSASVGSRESSPRVSRPSTSTADSQLTPTSPDSFENQKSLTNSGGVRTGGFSFTEFFGKKSI